MKIKKNSAFTLIETMIALVISIIAVGAIYYSYLFFKSSYQVILDKAAMSDSGRVSLSVISKDLRNAGYEDMNFNRAFDRKIEHCRRGPHNPDKSGPPPIYCKFCWRASETIRGFMRSGQGGVYAKDKYSASR